jgi:hypothetical protein
MSIVKRVALLFAVGGFVGDVVAMLIGPKALSFFQPARGDALCDCVKLAEELGTALIKVQLGATVVGGVVFVVGGLVLGKVVKDARTKAALDKAAPTSGA